jgi:dTDP-4-amino-4,6-dideoxygalactose transaminase
MSTLAIQGGTAVRTRPFPSWPVFDELELQGLHQALEHGVWSAADGPNKLRFEHEFAAYHQARHAIAVTNGTTSLELALQALGIGSGDEVIVPPYTFLATATAVLKVNATPIFADIDLATYCIDPGAVEAAITPRTKALICVHLGGHPAAMDRLLALKQRYGIAIVEDAAHAHGAAWRGQRVGALGDLGSFSFQASKNMTAGEGGIVLSNDEQLAAMVRSLHNCGRTPEGEWYEHENLGGNERLGEFQCALLLAQLTRLPQQTAQREASAAYLDRELAAIEGISPVGHTADCTTHARHLYLLRYDAGAFGGMSRDDFVMVMRAEGIPAANGYPIPLYRQPIFTKLRFDARAIGYDPGYAPTQYGALALPNVERACQETVWFGQNVLLGEQRDLDDILSAVHKIQRAAREVLP